MAMKILEGCLAFIPIGLIMIAYAVYSLKLRHHLEQQHPEFLDRSAFPEKMSDKMYYSSFRTGNNWIRFVYSDELADDPEIQRLKKANRLVILAAGIWLVVFTGIMLVLMARI